MYDLLAFVLRSSELEETYYVILTYAFSKLIANTQSACLFFYSSDVVSWFIVLLYFYRYFV